MERGKGLIKTAWEGDEGGRTKFGCLRNWLMMVFDYVGVVLVLWY